MRTRFLPTLTAYVAFAASMLFATQTFSDAGHGAEAAFEPGGKNYFSVNAVSDLFETVLRYNPIERKEDVYLTLFLSDFLSNRPVDSASIEISSPEDAALKFAVERSDKGTYVVSTNFPEKKKYNLKVVIKAGGKNDLMLLGPVEVGKQLPKAAAASGSASGNNNNWLWLALAFALGLGLMFAVMQARMRRMSAAQKATAMLLIVAAASLPSSVRQTANAHAGHGPKQKTEGALSDEIEVGKETQFLYEILTAAPSSSAYANALRLNGRVLPATNGSARVVAPQTGTITSLSVRIGQKVTKGQTLAVVQQTLTTSEQVGLTTERTMAEAEYQAAKKEYDRLQTLQDIVAKKELQAAEIRLNAAKENKAVYDRLGSGLGKQFTVVSPVAGTVDNFNLSVGQQIQQGDALMNVYDNRTLKIEATVYPQDMVAVSDSARYSVSLPDDAGVVFAAKRQALGTSIDPLNQSTTLVLEVENSAGRLLPGQLVNVNVSVNAGKSRAAIPAAAVTDIGGKPAVFVHREPEIFKIVYVQSSDGANATPVGDALVENDRIVVNGVYMLKSIHQNQ